MVLTPLLVILLTLCDSYAKIYERCELARELRNFDLPEDEIPTWVCIAQHESNYDTAAMNHGSGDHGLFQISQIYWCSPPGQGYGCNSPCSKFRDDDISDDLQCIRRIHNEHTGISGDGFNAWVVYPLYCKHDNSKYIEGCFDQEPDFVPNNTTENEIPNEEVDEYGDGYQFPALPNFPKSNKKEAIHYSDGYEFPQLPFSRVSIHDSISLNQVKYNFPTFPFSRKSINDFKLVNHPTEKTLSTTEKATEEYYRFPPLPVYSKQSIHHFIPVATTSQRPKMDVTQDEVETEYSFPPLPTGSNKTFDESKLVKDNEIRFSQEDTTESVYSKSTVSNIITNSFSFSTASSKQFFTSNVVTFEPPTTSKQRGFDLGKLITSSIQPPTTTSETKRPIFSTKKNSDLEYEQKRIKKFQSSQKSTEPKLATTISPPVSTKPDKSKFSLKPFSYNRAFSNTQKIESTTSKPFSITSKSSSGSKQFTLPYKSFTFKQSQPTRKYENEENSENGDLQRASSTLIPFRDFFKQSTTTFKPFFKSPTSDITSSGAFSQRNTSTKKSLESQSYRTSNPFTNYSFSSLTTPAPNMPMSKQVTFAPDSFFSWIFGSQTLPPLVGPSRPLRPPGERPGGLAQSSPTRPSIFDRPRPDPPGHLPRPPPRPNRVRPGEHNVLVVSQDVPAMRPHRNRPDRPSSRPFSTASVTQPRPSIPPNVSSEKTISSSSVSDNPLKGTTTGPKAPISTGRAGSQRNLDKTFFEVKLEDKFVFLRTKFGYRLFRSDKK